MLKKWFLIGLLGFGSTVLGGTTSSRTNYAIESKAKEGSSNALNAVIVRLEGKNLSIPVVVFNKIPLLKEMQSNGAMVFEANEIISYDKLQNLVAILQGANLDSYPIIYLVEIMVLAHFLLIEQTDLLSILNRIKYGASVSMIAGLPKLIAPIVTPLDVTAYLKIVELEAAKDIYANRQATRYLVKLMNNSGRLYDESGGLLVDNIAEVAGVRWSPNGEQYALLSHQGGRLYDRNGLFLRNVGNVWWSHNNYSVYTRQNAVGTWQLYNNSGNLVQGAADVTDVWWSPSGAFFFTRDSHNYGQLYSYQGLPIGAPVHNMQSMVWNAVGDRYYVVYLNQHGQVGGHGQLYNLDGNQISAIKSNVLWIEFNPQRRLFFAKFNNGTGGVYSSDNDDLIGDLITDVHYAVWSASGERCYVANRNAIRLYDYTGNLIKELTCPSWIRPRSGSCTNLFASSPIDERFFLNNSLYDGNGNAIGQKFDNVSQFVWQPNGIDFFIKFSNHGGRIYDKYSKFAGLKMNGVDIFKWGPDGNSFFVRNVANNVGLITGTVYKKHRFNDLEIGQQILVQFVLKQFSVSGNAVNLTTAQRNLLLPVTIEQLERNGYLMANSLPWYRRIGSFFDNSWFKFGAITTAVSVAVLAYKKFANHFKSA